VVVARGGEAIWREVPPAKLTMRDFSDAFIDSYLAARGEGILSSVGCYQLENEGVQLFSRIEGDYFTILGLPLMGLFDFLRLHGELHA
jgi:septum formation protein